MYEIAFDQDRLAPVTLGLWRRGGLDTLVSVARLGAAPEKDLPIGPCTTLRPLVDRLPAEIARLVGLAGAAGPLTGIDVFAVWPLPDLGTFEMSGYIAAEMPARTDSLPHPLYPPGRAPRWRVHCPGRDRLRRIGGALAGRPFRIEPRLLPALVRHDNFC